MAAAFGFRSRLLFLGLLSGLWLTVLVPTVPAAQEPNGQEKAQEDDLMKWKLINTAIFAVGLGFAIAKFAPKFFNARSLDIQQALKDATGLKIEADFRYSEIDKKMARLSEEVDRMRAESKAEMEREHLRLQAETVEEVEHMRRNSDAEIESLRAEGEKLVRAHTAELAMALAERRLQSQFAAGEPQDSLRDFVNLVEQGKN